MKYHWTSIAGSPWCYSIMAASCLSSAIFYAVAAKFWLTLTFCTFATLLQYRASGLATLKILREREEDR